VTDGQKKKKYIEMYGSFTGPFTCFDTVGWVTGTAFGPQKILHQKCQKDLMWATIKRLGLTWKELHKTRLSLAPF